VELGEVLGGQKQQGCGAISTANITFSNQVTFPLLLSSLLISLEFF
jgi:hypothetical protein